MNSGGAECPMALKMIAVQVLLEITSFLRETYPNLPKSSRMSVRGDRPSGWGPSGNLSGKTGDYGRRLSTAASLGYSHASAQSLQSVVEGQQAGLYSYILGLRLSCCFYSASFFILVAVLCQL